jgi:UDP-N-acetylglucosamine--dolichyl-phosphate N-acetylglucosaminephosphotransferase
MIDNYTFVLLIISILLAFAVTCAATPPLIKRMKSAGIFGIDVHKPEKPQISEMGGFSIFAGFAASAILAAFLGISLELVAVSLLVVTISAMIGALDDVVHLGAKEKPLLGFLAGVPLILTASSAPYLVVPLVGTLWLGLAWLPLVPFSVTAGANAVNTFAGFNGMEIGCGAILTFSLIVVGCLRLSPSVGIGGLLILAALLGALLGFFPFNRYPARIFTGDVGALCIGSAIAVGAIALKIELFAVIAAIPYIVNYAMVLLSVGKVTESHLFTATQVTAEGYLTPSKSYSVRKNLSDYILTRRSMKEPALVKTLWALCGLFGVTAIALAWLSII